MPPHLPRDRRKAKRDEIAQQWATWLKHALAAHNTTAADLARKSDGALDTGKITHWTNGDNTANPTSAALVARLLGEDVAEALRAAGHEEIADLAGRDPVLVLLDSIGMPDVTGPIAKQYLADRDAAQARAREAAERVRNEAANG